MKKLLSFVLSITIIICAVPIGAFTLAVNAQTDGYYTYTVSNGEATITYVDNAISGDITIPSTLGGYPVTSIGDYAFYCSGLTSIVIPNSITSIGEGAFCECTSLASITIPDSVTSIGTETFFCCASLTSISVSVGNQNYCSIDGILFNKDVTNLIQYPTGKTNTEYTIPDSVTNIGNLAFYGCKRLTNITIPDSVISIGDGAFSWCEGLTSVTIPDSVISIGEFAFFTCANLSSITIPDSVTNIGDMAFYDCKILATVYYRGSEEDRAKIIIGDNNTYLTDATWYYNSCINTSEHSYDNVCDADCNVCGNVRNNIHVYDDEEDTTCNICGFEKPNYISGDINNDTQINNKDLGLLMQYLNNWDVEINVDAADVNGDNIVNNKDYGLLMQYLNNWNVELK